jgi:molybdopterin-dependent oxidoreductase alpha subunit
MSEPDSELRPGDGAEDDAAAMPPGDTGRPPTAFTQLTVGVPPRVAGGLPAVASSLRHLREAGLGAVAGMAALRQMNQTDGFDCPGCAWPDPDEKRSFLAEYCENGAKAFAEEATTRRADAAFFARHSIPELRGWTDHQLGKSGRLTEPLVRRPGADHYTPIGWDEAMALAAGELARIRDTPDRAAFYTSGRTSNEAAFLYQLLVRRFGTNNLPDCSNMCHESSGAGLGETIGIGKGTVRLRDVETAELIIVMGQNPGTNHPRMLSALQAAKRQGAVIVAVNPLAETGLVAFRHPQHVRDMLGPATALADEWIRVRIGGDIAFLKGVMWHLDQMERRAPATVFDRGFLELRTEGLDAFLADLREHELADLEAESGIDRGQMQRVAELVAARPRMIVTWAMGLTQHRHGVANVREIVNLLLLRGAIGRPGAGACPVRGHSNVQGDRTVGIVERPPAALLAGIERVFGFAAPREHGLDTVAAIEAMERGDLDVFVSMGGNWLSATPDTDRVAAGLARCRLTVHVSTKPNRSHLIPGETSLILPALGRSERDRTAAGDQFVTVENSMGIVHMSRGDREPAGPELRSEPWIVAELAAAMERAGAMPKIESLDWRHVAADHDRIRELIEATIPGFDEYNRRVREPGGFELPNPPREGDFDAVGGRARFTLNAVPRIEPSADQLRMMTIRSHDQFNTTIYGMDDRYRGVRGERRVIFMHEADMADRGLAAEAVVDIESTFAGRTRQVERWVAIPYDIPRGCCATYFPEANPLVPLEDVAEGSRTPASKLVLVRVRPHARPSRKGGQS